MSQRCELHGWAADDNHPCEVCSNAGARESMKAYVSPPEFFFGTDRNVPTTLFTSERKPRYRSLLTKFKEAYQAAINGWNDTL